MQNNLLIDIGGIFSNLWDSMGVSQGGWQNYVMLAISFVLMFLAIVKKYEPMLLLPIAFGMFLINLPGAESILWGKHSPDLNYTIGVEGDVEYVGVYALRGAESTYIYVRQAGLSLGNGMVEYYASFDALQAGTVSTMTQTQFSELYSIYGYLHGTISLRRG